LRVLGKTYTVSYLPPEDMEDAFGICTPSLQTIDIDKEQTVPEELDTFIHECLHAIVRGMRIEFPNYRAEEAVVDRFGAGLAALFLDNPELLKYFQRLVKEANNG